MVGISDYIQIEAQIRDLVWQLNVAIRDGNITLEVAKSLYASLTEDIGWLRGCRDLLRTDRIDGQLLEVNKDELERK